MRLTLVIITLVLASFSLASCGRNGEAPTTPVQGEAKAAPFKGRVYVASDGRAITMTSSDELEVSAHGANLVCKYSQKDDVLRVVMTSMGTTQAVYYRVTPSGLVDPEGVVFHSNTKESAEWRGAEVYRVMDEEANMAGVNKPETQRLNVFRKSEEILPKNTLPLSAISVIWKDHKVFISVKYSETVFDDGKRSVYNFEKTVTKPVF